MIPQQEAEQGRIIMHNKTQNQKSRGIPKLCDTNTSGMAIYLTLCSLINDERKLL
jgi:hypothetical protein